MLRRSCMSAPVFSSFQFKPGHAVLLLSAGFLLFLGARSNASALTPHDARGEAPAGTTCQTSDSGFDESKDIYAVRNYEYRIAQLLNDENFELLDCISEAARSGKARLPGGAWKIHRIYFGLDEPRPGRHASEDDWNGHLARLEHWVVVNPDSITARVALAKSYVGYAWEARGSGTSDTVSDTAWKLFSHRLQRAKSILEDASSLKAKCPEWYVAMQQVALGEGLEPAQANQLLEEAVKFEAGYYYYYRMQANFLLPKWYGKEGDSSRFAEESANRVGGKQGDALYFLIATQVACACGEPEFGRFSWSRIQRGFQEIEKEYGQSMTNLTRTL